MNRILALAPLVVVPAVALAAVSAQEKKPEEKGAPAEMQMTPPQPGPHHARIKDFTGAWDAEVESMMGPPGTPPEKSKATETDMTVGGLWNAMDARGEFGGMPFHGHGFGGYDSQKKMHVGSWIDSFGDYITNSEGDCDGTCKVETTNSDMPNPMGPGRIKVKQVHEWKDKDTREFSMFMQGPDGAWMQTMKITYHRRVK
ncbi:MAG TPA: DUF1579 domain-containing protein [Planctomycetota bacterium]|jgi:hypothetical protein|nr:DUF1579 domain-containing protein [Planctomycetota bacterium]